MRGEGYGLHAPRMASIWLSWTRLFSSRRRRSTERQRQAADAVVSHVSEKDGHIYHECDKPLEVGAEVEAVLDWSVRLDRMQQHLGEHLLSYACWKLFEANNIGFHMNEDDVSLTLTRS